MGGGETGRGSVNSRQKVGIDTKHQLQNPSTHISGELLTQIGAIIAGGMFTVTKDDAKRSEIGTRWANVTYGEA